MNAILEFVYGFTEAERGSIMLLDEPSKELYIKIAKGLQQKIINQTRVKIGESLAGIVAQERKVLIIDKDTKDKRLLKMMNNPNLKYAMLIPIKSRQKLLGVLSVSTSCAESIRFTAQNAKVIDIFINLVESAICDSP